MWFAFKRLFLGLGLIVLCSAILLFSDWNRRIKSALVQTHSLSRVWKVSFVSYVATPFVEEAEEGTKEGLKQSGLLEGRDYVSKTRNAQGDIANLNNILDAVLNEGSDLIYTYTTPALQVSSQKAHGKIPVVFTLAVDPVSWGLGKSHADHPSNITGVYVSLPTERMLDVVQQCMPGIRKIGTVFTPSESNSVYVLNLLQAEAKKRGIAVITAPASSSTEVAEAAISLCSRGIDAVLQIPDNNTGSAFASIVSATSSLKIPLFGFSSPQAKAGAVVAVANDYFDAGRQGALLAARIMRGESPAGIPMEAVLRNKITINPEAARKAGMVIPDSVLKQADEIVQKDGSVIATRKKQTQKLEKKWNIHLIEYSNMLDVEESEQGILDGLREAGLRENQDFTLNIKNAQGDMSTLTSMVDTAVTQGADLLMTMSTPTLQAALQRGRNRPIVFTLVASAVAAGAGKTNEDHLPNVTGVVTTSAYEELILILKQCMPSAKRVGTLFVPSETNSVYNFEKTAEAAKKAGLELIPVPVNGSSEVSDAALSLVSRKLDAICQIAGNLTASSFPSIAEVARRSKIPVFAFQTNQAEQGAVIVVARDYYDGGRESALLAARVMRGENPAAIPFQPLKTTRLLINIKAARACGLKIPSDLLSRAARLIQ